MLNNGMNEVWVWMLTDVVNGRLVKPRDRQTLEILGHQFKVDMRRPVLTLLKRNLGYRFMAAEAAWMLSGEDRVAMIKPYSKTIANFSDDGDTFFGAYGPKIIDQMDYVIKTLHDKDTRQAVINIWRENPPKTKDVPCTLNVQFMIRENKLDLFVTMRSSDVWLGVPYDVFNFSMLGAYVLLELDERDLELGTLYNTAASRHLYMDDMEAAKPIINGEHQHKFIYSSLEWKEFGSSDDLIAHLWNLSNGGWKHEFNWLEEMS